MIEKRISNGRGLLATNGASRSNLFSGDASDVIFTYSKFTNLKEFYTKAWYFFYSNPYNFPRSLALYCWDILAELTGQLRQWVKNVQPRIRRGPVYLLMRATTNVFMREITTYTIVGDIITGQVDALYATYMGYDEIAHHSGVSDHDAFQALKHLDKHFGRLEKAKELSLRPYQIVILSDHGQSQGATFKQRYGVTLKDLVKELLPENLTIHSELYTNKDHFGEVVTAPFDEGKRVIREGANRTLEEGRQLKRQVKETLMKDTTLHPGNERAKAEASKKSDDVIVLASGNLGLVYFTQWKRRMTHEEITRFFPNMIPGLVNHNGVAFVLVQSEQYGPLVISANGQCALTNGTVNGEDPLRDMGPRAATHLRRSSGFKFAPDILVNSIYDAKDDQVAAFEELVGSHGGLGGNQSKPFLMAPSEWKLDGEIIGTENLHRIFKHQLEKLWAPFTAMSSH
jgi:putative membrane protein